MLVMCTKCSMNTNKTCTFENAENDLLFLCCSYWAIVGVKTRSGNLKIHKPTRFSKKNLSELNKIAYLLTSQNPRVPFSYSNDFLITWSPSLYLSLAQTLSYLTHSHPESQFNPKSNETIPFNWVCVRFQKYIGLFNWDKMAWFPHLIKHRQRPQLASTMPWCWYVWRVQWKTRLTGRACLNVSAWKSPLCWYERKRSVRQTGDPGRVCTTTTYMEYIYSVRFRWLR